MTKEQLSKLADIGAAAALPVQHKNDGADFMAVNLDCRLYLNDAPSREAFVTAVIAAYEAEKPQGQMQRTNHALALALAESEKALEEYRNQMAEIADRLAEPEPTPEEIERREFEAWCFDKFGLRREAHEYYLAETEAAWTAWKAKAARASKGGEA